MGFADAVDFLRGATAFFVTVAFRTGFRAACLTGCGGAGTTKKLPGSGTSPMFGLALAISADLVLKDLAICVRVSPSETLNSRQAVLRAGGISSKAERTAGAEPSGTCKE